MQNSSGGFLSHISILTWPFLYAYYGQKWRSLNKIQYFVKSTLNVVTNVFLQVSDWESYRGEKKSLCSSSPDKMACISQGSPWLFPILPEIQWLLKQRITNLTLKNDANLLHKKSPLIESQAWLIGLLTHF